MKSDQLIFADPFDLKLAERGPSGLFTFTHDGELQFDLFRTRDWRRRFSREGDTEVVWQHCVCVDLETKWPMYVLITSTDLVQSDDRTVTEVFDTLSDALERVSTLKKKLYELSGKTST